MKKKLTKFMLSLFYLVISSIFFSESSYSQNTIKGEKWEKVNNSITKKYSFYKIDFFSDSMYEVSFNFDSVVVAKYEIDNKFIYLSYMPFKTKGFTKNQLYYKISYKRNDEFVFIYNDKCFYKKYKYQVKKLL